MKFVLVLDYFD